MDEFVHRLIRAHKLLESDIQRLMDDPALSARPVVQDVLLEQAQTRIMDVEDEIGHFAIHGHNVALPYMMDVYGIPA